MAETSTIEWTDATWNPVTGCSVVSPGCTNCYAMRLAGGRLQHHPSRQGLTSPSRAGPVWNGRVRLNEDWLDQPLRWRRPRRIFVCAHGDLFHEGVPDEWIDRVFAVMALSPHHQFQVLTKRAERMRAWMLERWAEAGAGGRWDQVQIEAEKILLGRWGDHDRFWTADDGMAFRRQGWPLPNVWLGVSAEDQARADERIPHLLETPAAVRFLSAEPLLGPIDLSQAWHGEDALDPECWGECAWCSKGNPPLWNCRSKESADAEKGRSGIDWVIVGGESGPGARPMRPDWARALRDQCQAAGVPFFFKQWGSHRPTSDAGGEYMVPASKAAAGRTLDGRTWDQMPCRVPA